MAKTANHVTKCIYFPDKEKVEKLEAVLEKYPKATLSVVFAQMIDNITKSIEQLPEGQRQVQINTRIWI